MEPGKLPVEVEVGPRFEIFYALHKLFAPATPATDKWRKSARARIGSRLHAEAKLLAPEPLIWAILADCTLGVERIGSIEEVISAIEGQPASRFRATVIEGVPTARGSDLAATFKDLLSDAEDYRSRLVAVLRGFWSRVFDEDFAAVLPELNRMARQLTAAKANSTPSSAGERLRIPVVVDEEGGELRVGRGAAIPISRVGRLLLIPSAFNLDRWWTKRTGGEERIDFFFPLNDGTIAPNDALFRAAPPSGASISQRDVAATQTGDDIHPESVFRALGDTTRYAIATILAREPTTPSDLSRQLKVSRPTITHHVHALRDAGLIIEGGNDGKLSLDRSRLEHLSQAAVSSLFASEGKLKLSKTRKKVR